jgi:hypothetical protein
MVPLFGDLLLLGNAWSSFRYILVGMGMHWLEYIIGIAGNVAWNTFVFSVTITHLAYFRTAAPKYGVLCVFEISIYLKSTHHRCCDCQIVLDYQLHLALPLARYPRSFCLSLARTHPDDRAHGGAAVNIRSAISHHELIHLTN